MLTTDGLQVPVIPLVDVVGKGLVTDEGNAVPLQIANDVPNANTGVILGATVTVNVYGTPHCAALLGVKVYVPLAVLLTVAGLHVPVIPLVDVPGNGLIAGGNAAPLQMLIVLLKLNKGVTNGFTVTVNVVIVPHCKALFGVNV